MRSLLALICVWLLALPVTAMAGTATCAPAFTGNLGASYIAVGTCTYSSSYATGGDSVVAGNDPIAVGLQLCGVRKPISAVVLEGVKSGVFFTFKHDTLRLSAFQPGVVTGTINAPTGGDVVAGALTGLSAPTNNTTAVLTVAAPTITTGTNATVTAVIATNAGALTQAAGQTGLTGVQAPAVTTKANVLADAGTPAINTVVKSSYTPAFTGGATAPMAEVTATTNLSAFTIRYIAFCK